MTRRVSVSDVTCIVSAFGVSAGLAGEKVRWEETVSILEEKIGYLVGDCLVASAFMSYMGPFLSNYRDDLTKNKWIEEVRCSLSPSVIIYCIKIL